MKFSLAAFNEVVILFYFLSIFYLTTIEDSALEYRFEIGKIILFTQHF